jgi:XTP/dITP diphosphohydrolase
MPRRFACPKLVVATHNRGKAGEIRTLLSPFGVDIVSAGELGLSAPEETGKTFEDNATLKALAATRASGLPALADDSGLSVRALDGQPGLYTADWEGPTRDAMVGMRRIQDELAARKVPDTDAARAATFHCVLALSSWCTARSTAASSGRRAAPAATATIPASSRKATRAPRRR